MQMPSLNALRAFEAAARHESFVRAASELCVTEGAISRHVKLLEEELGVHLFRRLSRKVELTEQGRQLLPALTVAFANIAEISRRVSAAKLDLRIVAGPSISIRWLVPRLERFRARNLGFSVQLTTKEAAMSLVLDGSHDLAINCGSWPNPVFPEGLKVVRLLVQETTPVCAPRLLAGRSLDSPEKLCSFNLLHSSDDYFDWSNWARAYGGAGFDVARGQIYPNRDMAYRAAILGEGVAIGDLPLLGEELASGALVTPFPDIIFRHEANDYFVVVREESWSDPRIAAFCDWLFAERDASYSGKAN